MSSSNDHNNSSTMNDTLDSLQDIIGDDVGDRGMKDLIVDGDLRAASHILASLPKDSRVLILSGFPCCVNDDPPTETDGPPGAVAIARAVVQLGCKAIVVTDECNAKVFGAAIHNVGGWASESALKLQSFSTQMTQREEQLMQDLARDCSAIVACERAGPAADAHCYTMRGIDMTAKGLIAPLEKILSFSSKVPFVAIGDGGNELGMGKVLEKIVSNPKIQNGNKIACVIPADHLIAASVSNWGGYALAAGASLARANQCAKNSSKTQLSRSVQEWLEKCLATKEEEVALLQRCVDAGCRDGVSGKQEATVDGMPLETSMECLESIRQAILSVYK